MKFYYLFVVAGLALGCSDASNQDSESSQERRTTSEDSNNEAKSGLQQAGDYSSLFNRSDCKVITAEEISTLLGVPFVDMNLNDRCSFQSEFPGNKNLYVSISHTEMSSDDMLREIENFKSDETGLLALEMSDTGDTYFCIQHSHGYFSMYNPNYKGSILINYGSVGASRGFTKEERLEHKNYALKIANSLLERYKG